MFVDVTSICFQNKICLSTWVSWDLLFLWLLAPGAVTTGGTEETPELAHHVREGRVVAWYRWSRQPFRQGVHHLVLIDVVDVVEVDLVVLCDGVLLSTHHLLLTTRTENRPGELSLSLSLSTENCVLESGLVSPMWRCWSVPGLARPGQATLLPPCLYLQPRWLRPGRAAVAGREGGREEGRLEPGSSQVSTGPCSAHHSAGPAPLPAGGRAASSNKYEELEMSWKITTLIMATQCRPHQIYQLSVSWEDNSMCEIKSSLHHCQPQSASARARAVIHLQPNAGTESWLDPSNKYNWR